MRFGTTPVEERARAALPAVNAAHRREAARECGLRNAVPVVEVPPPAGAPVAEAPAPWSPICAFTRVTVLPDGVRVVRTDLTLTAEELEAFEDGRPSRLEAKVRKVARLGGLVEDELVMSDVGDAVRACPSPADGPGGPPPARRRPALGGPTAAGAPGCGPDLRDRVLAAQDVLLDAGFGGPYRLLVAAADPPLHAEEKAALLAHGIGVGTTRGGIGRLLVAGRPGVELHLVQDHAATFVSADGRKARLVVESRWSSRVTPGADGRVGICRILDALPAGAALPARTTRTR